MNDMKVREIAKKNFEDVLKVLQEQAKLAGFRIEASVNDPMEDAVADGPILIDAKAILLDTLHGNVMLAHSLGYNVRVDRLINPLSPNDPIIGIDVWAKRNEDGGYDEDVQEEKVVKPVVLPIENYMPERAIMEGFQKMNYAISDSTDTQAFYPAWQFIDPVPSLIPEVMKVFASNEHYKSRMHAFFVTQLDQLNELSPAEVLAGMVFATRKDIHSSQQRFLDYPVDTRLKIVMHQARMFVNPEM